MTKPKTDLAFTLVELLVVISIIGVLASLVLVSFIPAQKQARDAQRKSDLKQWQSSLETFANQNNSLYPAFGGITADDAPVVSGDCNLGTLCASLGLSGGPEDPKWDELTEEPTYLYHSEDI